MEHFALLGQTLGHSFSPEIHAKFGDYAYTLCETELQNLAAVLGDTRYQGFNVTIPYKTAVLPFCKVLTKEAERIGSVNTVLRKDGQLCGYNTDYDGFVYLLRRAGISVAAKYCLIFGSGGVSRTVQTALEDLGARKVVVISRSGKDNYQTLDRHKEAQILINTTPLGMYPHNGESPVSLLQFPNCEGVLDLIYNPLKTALILEAEARGIPASGGLPMLVAQAKKAAEIFSGQPIADRRLEQVLSEIEAEKKNLLFIGMPGCGKSYLGKKAAKALGRPFFDTDACIEEKVGMPIPKIFAQYGEACFRAVETEVLKEVTKQSGAVIATGGGVVTQPRNYPLLRQNSHIIWVQRELKKLETAGRPLSKRDGVAALYAERKNLYAALCDETYQNEG